MYEESIIFKAQSNFKLKLHRDIKSLLSRIFMAMFLQLLHRTKIHHVGLSLKNPSVSKITVSENSGELCQNCNASSVVTINVKIFPSTLSAK